MEGQLPSKGQNGPSSLHHDQVNVQRVSFTKIKDYAHCTNWPFFDPFLHFSLPSTEVVMPEVSQWSYWGWSLLCDRMDDSRIVLCNLIWQPVVENTVIPFRSHFRCIIEGLQQWCQQWISRAFFSIQMSWNLLSLSAATSIVFGHFPGRKQTFFPICYVILC